MINVAIAGVAGRMSGRIASLAHNHPEIKIVGAFERSGHKKTGEDIGKIIGSEDTGVMITDRIDDAIKDADVVIDFTSRLSTLSDLRKCSDMKKAMVTGTTGFTEDDIKEIRALAKNIPCVLAPNMSVGINLLFKILKEVAITLGDNYDVEIIEAHHRMKKDAPSGTALKMANIIAETLGMDINEAAVYARKGLIGERKKKEIGIQSIRAGDIVGEHTVMFATMGERIEISHKASSRDTFAKGAIRAALWAYGKEPGLYDMLDVLGLK
ncbi:4-hydroxy-tetrahydrodipicolinate reductase [bacterium BMS3Abin07]|nr:4-hydroxy-tetrahydrodipicolinate reductase [bacterium BMS3Abin07]GBE32938.1 4-hydroxy-tetrahydrodipicolinate reductase [bacterium BMS3Bbin05]HDL20043.1 4-hydroxy-tetrahydrodipicolinate reductase [Nitrospirota bacterium]HDO23071.1 4-hydroxy-tetrahydrodipicolinate reductase [Nitrospirota bacterium]HDZ87754.1 4-hydroxy-tetrahydrodipicolinate reductase [Nitrospirota bacterium]